MIDGIYFSNACQFFATKNIIVVFYKPGKIYIYHKKSFHKLRHNTKNTFESVFSDYMYIPFFDRPYPHLKNVHNLVKHKLNYSRMCKNVKYHKYINYLNIITNIIERLFSDTRIVYNI